jgi:hypothetical protein
VAAITQAYNNAQPSMLATVNLSDGTDFLAARNRNTH